ncbi:hypothetical protein [Oryzobacter terrae]|uniref:hypothetical protein n=1 Tax=Oryzobacter terrae TaxID=1620385 RepID=UPI00366C35EB
MPAVRTASARTLPAALALGLALSLAAPVAAGADPVLDLPASVDFGSTAFGHPVTRVVEIGVNGGAGAPVSFGPTFTQTPDATPGTNGEFSVTDDDCSGTQVAPGGTCSVTLSFRPWDLESREGTLLVRDPAGETIGTVPLAGYGTEDAEGTYYETVPTRLLDTRTSGTRKPLAAGSTTTVKVGGRAGVPTSGVSAVVVNLTAVDTAWKGYFTAYPSGKPRPNASTVNFPKGWTGASMATVPVGADGAIRLHTYGGPAHAVVDVVGWYAADDSVRDAEGVGTMLHQFGEVERLFDSRREGGVLRGGDHIEFHVDWGTPEDNAVVRSWVLNVTAVGATRPGVVTAWSGAGSRPRASTLNYQPGVVAPNMAVVTAGHPVGGGTSFRLDTVSSGSVHLVVDVVGVMLSDQESGLRFEALPTLTRIADSRAGLGLRGAIPAHGTRTLDLSGATPSPTTVVTTMTGILPSARTYLSVWPHDMASRPVASVLNVEKGQVRSASAYLPAGTNNSTDIYADARTDLVVDAVGSFYGYDHVNGGQDADPAARGVRPPAASWSHDGLPEDVRTVRR